MRYTRLSIVCLPPRLVNTYFPRWLTTRLLLQSIFQSLENAAKVDLVAIPKTRGMYRGFDVLSAS
jgi:hypothetical protein